MSFAAPTAAPAPGVAGPNYELRSDLAHYCLPAANRDETRKLAWACSVCLLFVVVACLALREPVFVIREAEPLPEPMPVVIVPTTETEPPPQEQNPDQPEEIPDELTEIPVVTPVLVANPENVAFAVPVEGYVALAPDARYVPPPPAVMPKPPPPSTLERPKFKVIRFGGGEFAQQPKPTYPEEFRRNRMGGTMELLITVETNGVPSNVEVAKSCGFPPLDRHVVKHIKDQWRAAPGEEVQVYKISITFLP